MKKWEEKLKFQPIDWRTKELELSSGRIDLIWNGYTITDERAQESIIYKTLFEKCTSSCNFKNSEIAKLDDLQGKKLEFKPYPRQQML